jgi:hypothetical protein
MGAGEGRGQANHLSPRPLEFWKKIKIEKKRNVPSINTKYENLF